VIREHDGKNQVRVAASVGMDYERPLFFRV